MMKKMKMSREMTNKEVARLLEEISAALEVKDGNRFKIAAYDRVANAIKNTTSEVRDLWKNNKLQEIPGIGTSLSAHLDELFRTGKVVHFEKIFRNLPAAMFEFLKIPGVGPKTAYKLAQELKIKEAKTAFTRLKKALKAGKIRVIEGFGEQSEKDILEGLKSLKKRSERMLLPFACELAQKVIKYLSKGEAGSRRIDSLGSLRRMTATIGDIDLAVATTQPKKAIKRFVSFPEAKEVVVAGDNTARIIHHSGEQIDLKTMDPQAYGALLQHFTGSKQHNIHLREIAQKKGLSLSEYGIKKGNKIKAYSTEEAFYQALGMAWIPPELREDTGEIEAAQKRRLPELIEKKDILGDLHVHSSFPIETSHDEGSDSFEVLLEKAAKLGYQYLGFSEHNPSSSQHSPKQIIEILKRKREQIDKLNYSRVKKLSIYALNSLEIDIKPDGSLALPDEALKYLDFAIASVHSSFKMPSREMTKRVLNSLVHPKIKILGHPTGRKLGEREGFELDWEKIFAFCLKNNKYLEINAWPNRLDLPDTLIRQAVKSGVKMVINTDAHAVKQLDLISYGVAMARRGWVTKNDIINTMGYNKLKKILNFEGR
jgi:DNA polymerase (family X)